MLAGSGDRARAGFRPRVGRVAAIAVLGLMLLAGCTGVDTKPQAEGSGGVFGGGHGTTRPATSATPTPITVTLATDRGRQSAGVIASGGPGAPYNYAPTVMATGGQYRMWWCGQLPGASIRPGDQVLYAVSGQLDGPFAGPDGAGADVVFGNAASGFDSLHTCDPSVIAVNGTYYLYYTGTSDQAGTNNAIGLATSPDGVHWTRANNGAAIVPAADEVNRANSYGAGQPSALYRDGWFYLMFTDTTALGADAQGAGQFVLRSPDPAFAGHVQSLTAQGFVDVPNTRSTRTRSILTGNTADWLWSDALSAFVLGQDTPAGTEVTFWDPTFSYHPYQPLTIGGAQQEGPGWVRTPAGHAPVSPADPCGRVPLDLVRATSSGAGPDGLTHFGVDVTGRHACQDRTTAARVLNGFVVPSPDRTVDLVVDGRLIEVERRSVALALGTGVLADPPAALADLPVTARLRAGAPAVVAPGRPLGLVLDDGKLWVIGDPTAAQLNSSTVSTVSADRWDGYPRGTDLTTLRP